MSSLRRNVTQILPLRTVWRVILTVYPTKSRWTGTGVTVHTIRAICTVFTRVALTFVDVFLASVAPETGEAGANERVHPVFAKSSITAGIWMKKQEDLEN